MSPEEEQPSARRKSGHTLSGRTAVCPAEELPTPLARLPAGQMRTRMRTRVRTRVRTKAQTRVRTRVQTRAQASGAGRK